MMLAALYFSSHPSEGRLVHSHNKSKFTQLTDHELCVGSEPVGLWLMEPGFFTGTVGSTNIWVEFGPLLGVIEA